MSTKTYKTVSFERLSTPTSKMQDSEGRAEKGREVKGRGHRGETFDSITVYLIL